MKKTITTLILMALSVSIMAAYAKSGGETKLTGKYFLTSVEREGGYLSREDMKELGMDGAYIEFRSDGKCKIVHEDGVEEETFKLDGGKLTLTDKGNEEIDGIVEENKIIFIVEGIKIVFEKK